MNVFSDYICTKQTDMGLFKKIFNKQDKQVLPLQKHKGFHALTVKEVETIAKNTVKVVFKIPNDLKKEYHFVPGQFINIIVPINKEEERRSYSICSGQDEDIAIAVKAVKDGQVSIWLNEILQAGDQIQVSKPEGNFKIHDSHQNIVAFAAGSGITPIFSMSKKIENSDAKMKLFYGNKSLDSIIFMDELGNLVNTQTKHFLSQEASNGYEKGRLTKEKISEIIKSDLNLLKSDCFFICGPEEMIIGAKEVLALFGVPNEKILFELYSTPVQMKIETTTPEVEFDGLSKLTVILDDEKINLKLDSQGKSILEAVNDLGFDAPYSCRGGVCCTCRAKVLEGAATMTLNYSLTDQEVKDGYILTCQAHPASENLVISYDA